MDFLDLVVFEIGNFKMTLLNLLSAIASVVATAVVIIIINKIIKKNTLINKLNTSSLKPIKNFVISIFILLGVYAFLESIGIPIRQFFNFKFVETDRINFKVFHIIVFYFIIVGTKLIISIIETVISAKEEASQIEKGKTRNIYQILKYFIYLIAIGIFVQSLGINITILIASLSALLLGLGLGVQHLFNDVVSGFILLFDRSIKIGDVIEIKEEMVGKVVCINLRTSVLLTRDDIEVIVPNSKFTSDNIINWTHNSIKTRFTIDVGVAYGSDVRLVEKILLEVASNSKKIADKPLPSVRFVDFGDSSLDFRLFFYLEENFRAEAVKSDLRFEIDKKFRENNVTIPFPQRDVHFYNHSK